MDQGADTDTKLHVNPKVQVCQVHPVHPVDQVDHMAHAGGSMSQVHRTEEPIERGRCMGGWVVEINRSLENDNNVYVLLLLFSFSILSI